MNGENLLLGRSREFGQPSSTRGEFLPISRKRSFSRVLLHHFSIGKSIDNRKLCCFTVRKRDRMVLRTVGIANDALICANISILVTLARSNPRKSLVSNKVKPETIIVFKMSFSLFSPPLHFAKPC